MSINNIISTCSRISNPLPMKKNKLDKFGILCNSDCRQCNLLFEITCKIYKSKVKIAANSIKKGCGQNYNFYTKDTSNCCKQQ